MPYTEILSLLDAEIARLEKARVLLLSLSSAAPRKATRSRAGAPLQIASEERGQEQSEVPVQKLRPRRIYGPRTKRVRPIPETESALRAPVPAGPVVVSASDVRRLESQKFQAPAAQVVEAAPPAWRAEVEQGRRTDDLLQRFMEMGSEPSRKEGTELAVTGTRG